MKRSHCINKILTTVVTAGLSLLANYTFGQALLSGGTYTQNFNSLPSTALASNAWVNGSTLQGWYVQAVLSPAIFGAGGECTNIIAATGTATAATFYSFGTNGVGLVTDRAMGSIGGNTLSASGQPAMAYGIRFTNDTGVPLTNFTVSYTGEEWRNGGNNVAQTLAFSYRVDGFAITNADPASTSTWTPVTALNFVTPVFSASAVALDGNAPANRANLSTALTGFVVFPDQEIFFRWLDVNDSGNDHAIALDDLTISFQTNLLAVKTGPSIVSNPTNLTIPEGNTATFTVNAGGTLPLYYQWYETNSGGVTAISGATGASFVTNFVPISLSGNGYFAVVTNNALVANVVTSSIAILTVTNATVVVTNIAYLHTLHNASFVLTDTNTLFQVEGVVTTTGDLVSGGGQSAFFQDSSGGMDLFFFTGTGTYALPNSGDHIRVTGQLSQFQGALEIQLTANPVHKLENLGTLSLPTPRFFNFAPGIDPGAMEGYITNGTTVVSAIEGAYVVISNVFLGITNAGGNLKADQTVFMTNLSGQTFTMRVPNNGVADPVGFPLPGSFATSVKGAMAQFQTAGTVMTNNYGMYFDLQANVEVGSPPATLVKPSINSITFGGPGGTNVIITGTNNNGATAGNYAVFVSTNITLALSNWTPVSTQAFNADGTFGFTNGVGPDDKRFYIIQAVP